MSPFQTAAHRNATGISYVCRSCRTRLLRDAQSSRANLEHLRAQRQHFHGLAEEKHTGLSRRSFRAYCETSGHITTRSKLRDTSSPTVGFIVKRKQHSAATVQWQSHNLNSSISSQSGWHDPQRPSGIRSQLREWQAQHLEDERKYRNIDFEHVLNTEAEVNDLSRLPESHSAATIHQLKADARDDDPHDAEEQVLSSSDDTVEVGESSQRHLSVGDLVELSDYKSEREAVVGVFVRRIGNLAQFFTMHGRWMHRKEKKVPYSIPGWADPELVESLIPYLPAAEQVEDLNQLMDNAYLYDMSVPRNVCGPLVTQMQEFHRESQELYRRHAERLDNAHAILAHDVDLRYSSLANAASTLLKLPIDQLPNTALWITRSALVRAGLGFRFDPRSHRVTGQLQILSKEQVASLEMVRDWFRTWQDDLAKVSVMSDRQRTRHATPPQARHFYSFIAKSRQVVLKSRETRDATTSGNIGPSRERFCMKPDVFAIRESKEELFTSEETEIVRFIELWSYNLLGHCVRLGSICPLLLQKIGLYEGLPFECATAFLFLQELGVLTPWENRVKFDPFLLLPSSQHSKPLQVLMTSVMNMRRSHDFQDSMAEIRHDWGDLPVYCIDRASAHEIDDGISIEEAGTSADGSDQYWVHVHIANPTAFFSQDHPLAKMARHMGETIYFPERAYMMLPRWATSRYFSLDNDRPCLTFSSKLDQHGKVLERKIQSGTIRNVFKLTAEETSEVLGYANTTDDNTVVMTVGGDPPPPPFRTSMVPALGPSNVKELQTLHALAECRSRYRQDQGAVVFDSEPPEVQVWTRWEQSGLAWDNPYRSGSRKVAGDPIVQVTTEPSRSMFEPLQYGDVLVREMMLLACATAAAWCAERQIPFLFRGTDDPRGDFDAAKYREEVLEPAAEKDPHGEWPEHLAHKYITNLGATSLSTRPRRHKLMGLDHYGKITSPLRRYGDMLMHWQIEAALREEAQTGRSLVSEARSDLSFLPFSEQALDVIAVSLQPRERLIRRAKDYATKHWHHLLLFRALHYGEAPISLPVAQLSPAEAAVRRQRFKNIRSVLADDQRFVVHMRFPMPLEPSLQNADGYINEFNTSARMIRPDPDTLGTVQLGDVWEAHIEFVHVYNRTVICWPSRLVERYGEKLV